MRSILSLVPGRPLRIFISLAMMSLLVGICIYDYVNQPEDLSDVDVLGGTPVVPELKPIVLAMTSAVPAPPVIPVAPQMVTLIPKKLVMVQSPAVSFDKGQTKEEVISRVGAPSGRICSPDRTVLIYGERQLEFVDGKLTRPVLDLPVQQQAELLAHDMTLDQKLKTNLSKVGEWACTVAKTLAIKTSGIVLLDKEGDPSHHGQVTVVDYGPVLSNPFRVSANEEKAPSYTETDIVLRKVEGSCLYLDGSIVGRHAN